MRETDKTPTQCQAVQGKDSPCAVRERARIRAKVQAAYDRAEQQGAPASGPFDAGRIITLHQVLDMIDRKDASHE